MLVIELDGVVKKVEPGKMTIAKKNVRYWLIKNATIAEIENCPQLKAMKKETRLKLRGKNAKVIIQVEVDLPCES